MISSGVTSDIIVAAFLALSQLIDPVPEGVIVQAEQKIKERNSCQAFEQQKTAFASKKCEELRKNRREFRGQCQSLENEMNQSEVQCSTDPSLSQVLRFRPRKIEEYLKLSNQELVSELFVICSALQDRIFLEPEEWMKGVTANRDGLSSKLVVLQKPELQDMISKIVKEASDGDFRANVARDVITALCHWKADRKAVAEQVDFTGGYKYLQEMLDELPNVEQLPELPQASFVYDNQGQRIGEIFDKEFIVRNGKKFLGKVHRRRMVNADQIPPLMFNAFIAIEDKRFRQHNGFDFEALKRLYYSGVQGGKEGGSTFTMQLVKNAFFHEDVEFERGHGKRTIRRKLKEILMLPMVERKYSKDEILAYYLNLIDLTPTAQGVLMASMDLFGKSDLKQLTLSEIALLAAMPKGSSLYNPRRFPERSLERRNLVLQVMEEQGYITADQRAAAVAEGLHLAPSVETEPGRIYSRFFTGHLTNHFTDLKAKNLRDPRWVKGGFDIKTSLNLNLQKAVQKSLQDGLLDYEKNTSNPRRGGSRYRWKPWLDETTGQNMNLGERLASEGLGNTALALQSLRIAHPYPETDWIIAMKPPSSLRQQMWMLENGENASVSGADREIYRSLREYDVVLLEKNNNSYNLASGTDVQGAAVVMDIETGDVLALTGGFTAGAYGKFAQNNRATRSLRQPGSTVKPFTYLYALNQGVPYDTTLSNYAIRFPKIDRCPFNWTPENYSNNGATHMALETALENSVNRSLMSLFTRVAGVRINRNNSTDLAGVGPDQKKALTDTLYRIYDFASQFGAYPDRRSLMRSKSYPCLPFLLGGYETTPLNMAQAYSALGNGGLRREAVFLREVLKGETPLVVDQSIQKRDQLEQYRNALRQGFARAPEAFGAISGVNPEALLRVRTIMQGILKRGTATRISKWADLIGGKTGTTNNNNDAWFVGFNAKVAVVVWVGYDSKKEFDGLGEGRTGASVAVPIFERIMTAYYDMFPDQLKNVLPRAGDVNLSPEDDFGEDPSPAVPEASNGNQPVDETEPVRQQRPRVQQGELAVPGGNAFQELDRM